LQVRPLNGVKWLFLSNERLGCAHSPEYTRDFLAVPPQSERLALIVKVGRHDCSIKSDKFADPIGENWHSKFANFDLIGFRGLSGFQQFF
jgi:hypothetical protein